MADRHRCTTEPGIECDCEPGADCFLQAEGAAQERDAQRWRKLCELVADRSNNRWTVDKNAGYVNYPSVRYEFQSVEELTAAIDKETTNESR